MADRMPLVPAFAGEATATAHKVSTGRAGPLALGLGMPS